VTNPDPDDDRAALLPFLRAWACSALEWAAALLLAGLATGVVAVLLVGLFKR
jgi:hypothetical protein